MVLGLTDSKYLGVTSWAVTLSSRSPILHCNGLRVLDLHLLSALHTISLHSILLSKSAKRLARLIESVNRYGTVLSNLPSLRC
jgi:hypothetical protein